MYKDVHGNVNYKGKTYEVNRLAATAGQLDRSGIPLTQMPCTW